MDRRTLLERLALPHTVARTAAAQPFPIEGLPLDSIQVILACAFEQATNARREPGFLKTVAI